MLPPVAVTHAAEVPGETEGPNSGRALLGAHLSPPCLKAARCPSETATRSGWSVVKLKHFLALSQDNSSAPVTDPGMEYCSQKPHSLTEVHKLLQIYLKLQSLSHSFEDQQLQGDSDTTYRTQTVNKEYTASGKLQSLFNHTRTNCISHNYELP